MNKISIKFIDLAIGEVTRMPSDDGVYLKSFIAQGDNFTTIYPTTTCAAIAGDAVYYSEMKFNLYKKSHPNYWHQTGNLIKLLKLFDLARVYSTDLKYATDQVAIVDEQGIFIDDEHRIDVGHYRLTDETVQLKADAILTNLSDTALISYSADCPTAFLRDRSTGAIGVLHSMWKGLVIERKDGTMTSIVEATVKRMQQQYGTHPSDLEVAIYPCISLDRFCVDTEVADKFKRRGLGAFVYESKKCAQPHIDLRGAMREIFEQTGVKSDSIQTTPFTTDDYGLNSFRGASVSYSLNTTLLGLTTYEEVASNCSRIPAFYSDKENQERQAHTNALNFLIAIKH